MTARKFFQPVLFFLLSLFSTAGICAIMFDLNAAYAKKVLWIVVFLGVFFLIRKGGKIANKRAMIVSAVIAILLALFLCVGKVLNESAGFFAYFILNKSAVVLFLVQTLGVSVVFYAILMILYDSLPYVLLSAPETEFKFFTNNRLSFLLGMTVIFVCWLPYFLAYYPGSLSPDSVSQLNQAVALAFYDNTHPIVHTLFISFFVQIGLWFGSLSAGVALYSIAQMLIMAAIFSYAIVCLAKWRVNVYFRMGIFAIFAFAPLNAFHAFTMWKDILFAGLFLMLVLMMIDMIIQPREFFKSRSKIIAWVILIILFMLFRNNGLYAFILLLPFILIGFFRFSKRFVIITLACAVFVLILTGPIYSALRIDKSFATRVSLSVPIQQIARAVTNHRDLIDSQDLEILAQILPVDRLAELYNPRLSDPIIFSIDFKAFNNYFENPAKYNNVWGKLFAKFPTEFIESIMYNSYGYWYPDVIYRNVHRSIYTNSFDLVQISALPAQNFFYEVYRWFEYIPVMSMLHSPAIMFWIALIAAGWCIIQRKYLWLLPFVLIFTYWLTILASPIYAELRYVYGIHVSAPIYLAAVTTLMGRLKKEENVTQNA